MPVSIVQMYFLSGWKSILCSRCPRRSHLPPSHPCVRPCHLPQQRVIPAPTHHREGLAEIFLRHPGFPPGQGRCGTSCQIQSWTLWAYELIMFESGDCGSAAPRLLEYATFTIFVQPTASLTHRLH